MMPNAESGPTDDASIHRCGVLNGLERCLVQQLGELETEQSTRGWILDRELENGFEWVGEETGLKVGARMDGMRCRARCVEGRE